MTNESYHRWISTEFFYILLDPMKRYLTREKLVLEQQSM